jgi:hypothetical protein
MNWGSILYAFISTIFSKKTFCKFPFNFEKHIQKALLNLKQQIPLSNHKYLKCSVNSIKLKIRPIFSNIQVKMSPFRNLISLIVLISIFLTVKAQFIGLPYKELEGMLKYTEIDSNFIQF